jgi:hypothetical protein
MQAGGSVTALAYATAEKVDPGWLTCTAVDTEKLSDCAIEIAPVWKSTAKVTWSVRVPEDVADTLPAADDALTLVAAATFCENAMYSLLPCWYSCAVVPAPRLLKVENSPDVPKRRSRKPVPSGPMISTWVGSVAGAAYRRNRIAVGLQARRKILSYLDRSIGAIICPRAAAQLLESLIRARRAALARRGRVLPAPSRIADATRLDKGLEPIGDVLVRAGAGEDVLDLVGKIDAGCGIPRRIRTRADGSGHRCVGRGCRWLRCRPNRTEAAPRCHWRMTLWFRSSWFRSYSLAGLPMDIIIVGVQFRPIR